MYKKTFLLLPTPCDNQTHEEREIRQVSKDFFVLHRSLKQEDNETIKPLLKDYLLGVLQDKCPKIVKITDNMLNKIININKKFNGKYSVPKALRLYLYEYLTEQDYLRFEGKRPKRVTAKELMLHWNSQADTDRAKITYLQAVTIIKQWRYPKWDVRKDKYDENSSTFKYHKMTHRRPPRSLTYIPKKELTS